MGARSVDTIGSNPRDFNMSNARTSTRRDAHLSSLVLLFVSSILLTVPAPSSAQQSSPTIDIAKAYGLGSFDKIEAIRYTWNVDAPFGKIANTWEWSPKTDTVSYDGKDKDGKEVKATYKRSEL